MAFLQIYSLFYHLFIGLTIINKNTSRTKGNPYTILYSTAENVSQTDGISNHPWLGLAQR